MKWLLRPICWVRGLWWSRIALISGHIYQDQPEYTDGDIVYQPGRCITCGHKTVGWYNKFDPPMEV